MMHGRRSDGGGRLRCPYTPSVDHAKVLYHFSSVHYKTLLCPHRHMLQAQGGHCEYSPSNVESHEVPGADERYSGSQSLRSLPHKKCVFIHHDDFDNDMLPSGWKKEWCHQNGRYYFHNAITGKTQWECPWTQFELFDPTKFNKGRY